MKNHKITILSIIGIACYGGTVTSWIRCMPQQSHTLPFQDLSDLQSNVSALARAFEFYSITRLDGAPITRSDTSQFVARMHNYCDEDALAEALAAGAATLWYYDGDDRQSEAHQALACELVHQLSAPDGVRSIKAALSFSGYGCTTGHRAWMQQLFGRMPRTLHQWHELDRLARGYAYATRYNRGSAFDREMLRYEYDLAVARVLNTPAPKRPRKPSRQRLLALA